MATVSRLMGGVALALSVALVGCGGASSDDKTAAPCDGTRTNGRCLVRLATAVDEMTVSGGTVYYTPTDLSQAPDPCELMAVPATGGSPSALATGLPCGRLAANATSVVSASASVISTGPPLEAQSTVIRVPIEGGTPVTLGSAPYLLGVSLVLNATDLYLPLANDGPSGTRPLVKLPLSGGPMTTLVGDDVGPVAIDSTNVYWVDDKWGAVMKMPLAGGTSTKLASANPSAIAVGPGYVYWTTGNSYGAHDGTVMKVPIVGGAPVTLASGQDVSFGMAVDSAAVYWVAGGANGGSIMKVPVGGGTPVTLWTGYPLPLQVEVDATSVYWLEEAPSDAPRCDVMRLTPK